ncbi:MAG: VOC family protein [Acetobacteraceae bacterium]
MSRIFPVPTLDHVVINVRDRIDDGADTWRRLGFTLTPRGYHTLGSMNHLAMFGTDYLELIAARPGDTGRPEILGSPAGLNGLVFGTDDSAAVFRALEAGGVPVLPPQEFSRPVELADGPHDATFRTVRLPLGTVPDGRLYFCHHLTRDLVWRDEWRHHANGAVGVARAVIASANPARWSDLFGSMFGPAAVRAIPGGCTLAVGLSRFDVVTPAVLAEWFGDAAPSGQGRTDFMAGLTFRTRSLEEADTALRHGKVAGVVRQEARIVVPADAAFGAVVEFVP